MPRKQCFWTRELELELVEFVRQREYIIWRYIGNTNHHIHQKYKAYAEFAARFGRGFTARSVRDRWVNIRSTFHHNLRKVEKSKENAKSEADVYVPCWPLWKPMQFLKEAPKNEDQFEKYSITFKPLEPVKGDQTEDIQLAIRQQTHRTDRPHIKDLETSNDKCKQVLDDLLQAMKPLQNDTSEQKYWFFGKHVAEELSRMRETDANTASQEIIGLLDKCPKNEPP